MRAEGLEDLVLSEEEFEELEKIADLATPPPLEAIGQEIHSRDGVVGQTGRSVGAAGGGVHFDLEVRANAQLYAAAHRLLATAKHWREEARRLQQRIDDLGSSVIG
jgi:hypothetical protein